MPLQAGRRGADMQNSNTLGRRWLIQASLLLVLAAIATVGAVPAVAQEQPLKVGVVASITGGTADINNSELNGLKLYLEKIGGTAGGRDLKLLIEDDAGDPGTGLAKVRKLVELDKVDVIVGPFLAHVVAATQDYIGSSGIPNIVMVGQPPENVRHPNVFVPSWNAVQLGKLMGEYAFAKLGHKTANIVSSKYGFGIRVSEGFKSGFTSAGGAIKSELFIPLGTADWLSFLAGLPSADTVLSAIPGGDAIKYVRARADLGQTKSMPLTGVISTVDGVLLPSMGSAADGAIVITHYLETLSIPQNKQFVADYKAKYGSAPSGYYEALGYTIGQVIGESLKQTNGKSEAGQLIQAIRKVDFDSPQGRFRFAAGKQFPLLDFYFVKVVPDGNKRGYEILDVRRDVAPD
ncbi:ABC transporter substrate-binding protein [Bradyrhizobium sp. TM239]|nr:ABC transporter substrate-binding protein [Bradyrhizobium sp. TM239]